MTEYNVLSLFPPCALPLIAKVAISFSFQAISEITFNSANILNKTERVLTISVPRNMHRQ